MSALFRACLFFFLFASISGLGVAFADDLSWPEPANPTDNCVDGLTTQTGTIARISDGDTVVLGDDRRVRLIGINTTELNAQSPVLRKLAEQARDYVMQVLPAGTPVQLYIGKDSHDQHGRLLAHVVRASDDLAVAHSLLETGLAMQSAVAPNTRCAGFFSTLEASAKKQKLGVWGQPAEIRVHAKQLDRSRGFMIVSGTVTNLTHKKKHSELLLDDNLSVRVRKRLASSLPLESLVGQSVEVRGWLTTYKQNRRVRLHHPVNLTVIDD